MHPGRHSAPPVLHGDTVVLMYRYDNMISVAGKNFIDGIVDDLIYQMVQAACVRRTDVHSRSFSDGFQAFKHLYGIFVVIKLLFSSQTYKPLSKNLLLIILFFKCFHVFVFQYAQASVQFSSDSQL